MSPNERRKIRSLNVITVIGIPIAFLFALLYAYAAKWEGVGFGLVIAAVLFACRVGVARGAHRATYFSGAGLLTLIFLGILATGTGAPHNISWFYILPLVFFIFLELVYATIFMGVTTAALFVLLVRPDLTNTYAYDSHLVLRFFIVYFLISLVAWAYEATRNQYEMELGRQNQEIRAQKDFSATLLETLPNPFFYKDTQGRYLRCNQALAEMLGLPRERIIGRTVFDVAPEDLAQQNHDKDLELIKSPGKQTHESRILSPHCQKVHHVIFHKSTVTDDTGRVQGIMGVVFDVSDLKEAEAEKNKLIRELETALAEIKTLGGMLPICSACKKIRDDQGYWQQLETYIETHSQALFSHSICPSCSRDLYGDQPWFDALDED
jgi:PAS domain S-box-containing protein